MPIRVLIVDDSPTMQAILREILAADPEIEVAGVAANPHEARSMIKALPVDVVTLDVEMPQMDGLEFLEKLMRLHPMPVVMISGHTGKGTKASIEALSIGALACLPRPRIDDAEAARQIRQTVKEAAASSEAIKRLRNKPVAQSPQPVRSGGPVPDLVLVGSSTGGVEALTTLLSGFPADCPPTVIAQHMPAGFTRSLADRLNGLCQPTIGEAVDLIQLQKGHVYFAPSGKGHTRLGKAAMGGFSVRVADDGQPRNGHMPSVCELFSSAVPLAKNKTISAALLTGMGRDGAEGMLELRNSGCFTVAQDEATSLIYGMPRAAAEIGAAGRVLPLQNIADAVLHPKLGGMRNVA